VALLDAGYGNNSELRANITWLGFELRSRTTGLFLECAPTN
jgi:hypothetical protein